MASKILLTGVELLAPLMVTKIAVKYLQVSGAVNGCVSPEQAYLLVKSGNFKGKCNPARTRVYQIQEIPDPRPVYRDDMFRVDRPMINACSVTDLKPWMLYAEKGSKSLTRSSSGE